MTNSLRDQNQVTVGLAVSSVDNVTPLMLKVDPVTSRLLVSETVDSLTTMSAVKDKRDQNYVPTMYGVSSVDGITLVPIRTDSNGVLLTQYT